MSNHKMSRKYQKPRRKQWYGKFLASLAQNGVISVALREAGKFDDNGKLLKPLDRRATYREREINPEFAQAWDDAMDEFLDAREVKLYESCEADNRPAQWNLQVLARRRPEVWGDPTKRVELTTNQAPPQINVVVEPVQVVVEDETEGEMEVEK